MDTRLIHAKISAGQLTSISEEELAVFKAEQPIGSLDYILAEREFERRSREAQHKYDLQLIVKQGHWQQFSAVLGAVATLVGAIVGATLTFWLQKTP